MGSEDEILEALADENELTSVVLDEDDSVGEATPHATKDRSRRQEKAMRTQGTRVSADGKRKWRLMRNVWRQYQRREKERVLVAEKESGDGERAW